MQDHPIEIAFFNDTGLITFLWLLVRVWLGWQWIAAGLAKFQSNTWMNGTQLLNFWQNAIKNTGADYPSIGLPWYSDFLQGLVNNQAQTWVAPLIAGCETVAGICLILGLFTGVVALSTAFMSFNVVLAGSGGMHPVLFVLAILLVMAWKNAGWWGLDRFVLPALGTPWHPGTLVRRSTRPTPIAPEA